MIRLLCALLLSALAWQASADALLARVDRTRLDAGESIELSLESSDPTLFGKPDLTPLHDLFEVLGTRQVNSLHSQEGQADTSTAWIITLQPKQHGFLVIPPLQVGDLQSQPITLYVREGPATGKAQLDPVFIDASLNRESIYVQAQAILTLRVYHSISLYDDSSLTPLQMADARIEQIGQIRTYETTINGVRHGVIEVRYALFPQRSGELSIPPLVFNATEVSQDQGQDGESPFGPRPGRAIKVESPPLVLQVKAKPAAYPADAPWLPARSLSLSESWSPEPEQARVGDSLTRNLLLKAEGLAGVQLPPLSTAQVDGLRRYPEPPQMHNEIGERGLIGSREEREALIPTRDGRIELPALEILWWNTVTDRLERANLPARSLEVAVNPNLSLDSPSAASAASASLSRHKLWPWQLASGLLLCTTVLGFGLWWHARRQPAVLPTMASGPSPRTLLDDLRRACLANDTQATRQALDAWARQQPETLADMAARFVPLSDSLDGLNGALYSASGQHWLGEDLWQAICDLPPTQATDRTKESSALPPLYPR